MQEQVVEIREKMICLIKLFFMNSCIHIGEIIEIEKAGNRKYCFIYYKGKIIDYVSILSISYKVMPYSNWLALEREKQIKSILDD
jgi:hypothetical protein